MPVAGSHPACPVLSAIAMGPGSESLKYVEKEIGGTGDVDFAGQMRKRSGREGLATSTVEKKDLYPG